MPQLLLSLKSFKSIIYYYFLLFTKNSLVKVLLYFTFSLFLSLYLSNDIIYCIDESNNSITNNNSIATQQNSLFNSWRQLMDTRIRFETTPGQIGSALTSLGITGATGWGIYYGFKGAAWASEIIPGTPFTKGALVLSDATIGGTYGLMAYAIARKQGPQGPFGSVIINPPIDEPLPNIQLQVNNDGINIISPLESEISFNPFIHLNPIADNPDIALLSCGIIFILAAIQCLNFILIRYIILKYSSKISNYLESYPTASKAFKRILNVFENSFTLYLIAFVILGYLALIGALIATLSLLHFMPK